MSMFDPFNPHPGSMPGAEPRIRRPAGEPGRTRSFLWAPAVIVVGIGVIALIAAT